MISRSPHLRKLVAAAFLFMQSVWTANAADVHYAAEIWTGNGQIIHRAAIVITDGKITALGPRDEVSVPRGAIVHDHGSGILIPGLVIAQTSIAENGQDEEETLTPSIQAIDGFDFFGRYENLLATGITTVQLSPGSQRLMPGQGSVVKLGGDNPRTQSLRDSESIRILLTEAAFNPPRLYTPPVGAVSVDRPLEPTRPQLAGNLSDAVTGLRALMLATRTPDSNRDPILSVLRDAMESHLSFRFTVRSAAEISAAWRLIDEFQLPAILVGLDQLNDAPQSIPWSHDLVRGIVLEGESGFSSLSDLPTTNDAPRVAETWQRLTELKSAGVLSKTALTVAGRNLDDLWFVAARSLASGIEPQELLSLLTENPAKIMAIDERVGTLAEGRDADFVVLTGRPFTPQGRVAATYIDGRSVFEREAQNDVIVVRAAKIEALNGHLENGEIVVSNGRIRGVGKVASAPRNAQFFDFPEGVIVPGFIDSDLRVGTGSGLSDRLPLNQKIGSWLATDDPALALVRQGGITTGLLASTSRPSPVVAFKLTDSPRTLADPVAIRYSIGGNLTAEEGNLRGQLSSAKTYAEAWRKYEAAFAEYSKQLAQYEQAKAKYDAAMVEAKKKEEASKQSTVEKKDGAAEEKPGASEGPKTEGDKPTPGSESGTKTAEPTGSGQGEPKPDATPPTGETKLEEPKKPEEPPKPQKNEALDATRPLIEGKLSAIVDVDNARAVQLALKLFVDEFQLKLILSASGNSYLEADAIAGKSVPVIVSPPLETRVNGEWIDLVEVFRRAGTKVVVASGAGTGAKNLPLAIAHSSFNGLGTEDALHAVTDIPANLLQIPSVGSIAPGKDADFVIFSGPVFEPASRIIAVMIDGRWVYRTDEKEMEHNR